MTKLILFIAALFAAAFNAKAQGYCGTPDVYKSMKQTETMTIPRDTVVKLMKKTMNSRFAIRLAKMRSSCVFLGQCAL